MPTLENGIRCFKPLSRPIDRPLPVMIGHSSDGTRYRYPDGTEVVEKFKLTDEDRQFFRICRRMLGTEEEYRQGKDEGVTKVLINLGNEHRLLKLTSVHSNEFVCVCFNPLLTEEFLHLEQNKSLPENYKWWEEKFPDHFKMRDELKKNLQIVQEPFNVAPAVILHWSSDSGDKGNMKCQRLDYETGTEGIVYTVFYIHGQTGDFIYEIRMAKLGSEEIRNDYLETTPIPYTEKLHEEDRAQLFRSGTQEAIIIKGFTKGF